MATLPTYVTIWVTVRLFEKLEILCSDKEAPAKDELYPFATQIIKMLSKYCNVVKSDLVSFPRVLDPLFRNDNNKFEYSLRKCVDTSTSWKDLKTSSGNSGSDKKSFIEYVMEERSVDAYAAGDEIKKFLLSRIHKSRGEPLDFQEGKHWAFPKHWYLIARYNLSASFFYFLFSCESSFSIAMNLIYHSRGRLSDESINACMCVASL